MSLTLTPGHGYTSCIKYGSCASAVISFQAVFSVAAVSALRKQFKVPYPDSGDGHYAAKLSDEEHYQFHCALRAHRNYTEQLGVVQSLLFASSILHPKISAGLGALYIVGRQFYYHGYVNKGPKGRFVSTIIIDLGLLGLLFTTIYFGLTLAGVFNLLS